MSQGRWDKQPPAPVLPDWLVEQTSERYQAVFERLTGVRLDEVSLDTWGVE